jgi:hypothetical protein
LKCTPSARETRGARRWSQFEGRLKGSFLDWPQGGLNTFANSRYYDIKRVQFRDRCDRDRGINRLLFGPHSASFIPGCGAKAEYHIRGGLLPSLSSCQSSPEFEVPCRRSPTDVCFQRWSQNTRDWATNHADGDCNSSSISCSLGRSFLKARESCPRNIAP